MTFQPDPNQAVDDLRVQLALWRESNKTPKRIPREIWAQATELATIHGVGRISAALHLDHACLKKKVALGQVNPASVQASFFELIAPSPSTVGRCSLEVESARGAKLRVELACVSATALGTMLREFGG